MANSPFLTVRLPAPLLARLKAQATGGTTMTAIVREALERHLREGACGVCIDEPYACVDCKIDATADGTGMTRLAHKRAGRLIDQPKG